MAQHSSDREKNLEICAHFPSFNYFFLIALSLEMMISKIISRFFS